MDAGDLGSDDLVRERLREATSGDTAVRQLRRRYDALRRDYEHLLDRLSELEERLGAPDELPAHAAGPGPLALLEQALANPLLELRDAYTAAAARIQALASGLDRLALGALKGQRSGAPAPPHVPVPEPVTAGPEPIRADRPSKVHLDVRGSGFGDLLDFQERLSAVPGVARVSINAIDADRATLVVELDPGGHAS
jgi:hypothetical protein